MPEQDTRPQHDEPSSDPTRGRSTAAGSEGGPTPTAGAWTVSRRTFVIRSIAALGAVATAIVAVPVAAFMSAPGWLSDAPRRLISHTLSPALRSEEWTSAGPLDRLRIGRPQHMIVERPIVDGWVKRNAPVGVYVLRENDHSAVVIDPHCTHLGCPVEFSSGAESFLCPCHGGSFDPDGHPTAGPPPRRLDTYETRVTDGEVFFRKLTEPEA